MKVSSYLFVVLFVCLIGTLALAALAVEILTVYQRTTADTATRSPDYVYVGEIKSITAETLVALDLATVEASTILVIVDRLSQDFLSRIESLERSLTFRGKKELAQTKASLQEVLELGLNAALAAPDSPEKTRALDAYDLTAGKLSEAVGELIAAAEAQAESESLALSEQYKTLLTVLSLSVAVYCLVIFMLWRLASRKMIRPLEELTRLARESHPTLGSRVPMSDSPKEVQILSCAFSDLIQRLHEKIHNVESEMADRIVAEDNLRKARDQYRELAETIDDVFWISNPNWSQVHYVSPGYETIWGRTCESLYLDPRSWFGSISEEHRKAVLDRVHDDSVAEEQIEEYRIIRPDHKTRWIRNRTFQVKDELGKTTRLLGLAQDISGEVSLQNELRHSQKMESIGHLAAGVAHDFNNLLTVVLVNIELFAENPVVRGHPELFDRIRDCRTAVTRASSLTRQLLLFGRKEKVRLRSVELSQLVRGLAGMLKSLIGERIELELGCEDEPCHISGDPSHIEQLLVNLAVNARDAIPDSGSLHIETSQRDITAENCGHNPDAREGRFVCLAVRDTGTGIPSNVLPKIFDPFFTTKEVGKGTGLGLAAVYGITKEHKGWIEVETESGLGTALRMFFPQINAKLDSNDSSEPSPVGSVKGFGETILLVEDEIQVLGLEEMIITQNGYGVRTAKCGDDALAVWKKHLDTIDLVVTDIVMPGGMNGIELMQRIRQDRPGIGAVYVSGYSEEARPEITEKDGRDGFVGKPFDADELLSAIRSQLDTAERVGGYRSPGEDPTPKARV